MRYAWIENGVVTNIIVLNDRNASDFPAAVKLGDRPAGIGDTYSIAVSAPRAGWALLRGGELM